MPDSVPFDIPHQSFPQEVLETLPLEALDETEKVLRTSRNKAVKRAVISVLAEKMKRELM